MTLLQGCSVSSPKATALPDTNIPHPQSFIKHLLTKWYPLYPVLQMLGKQTKASYPMRLTFSHSLAHSTSVPASQLWQAGMSGKPRGKVGGKGGGERQKGGRQSNQNVLTKKEIMFFQQVVNSDTSPSLTILIKLISPHAVMKNSRTKPPWNHENCTLLLPRDLLRQ